MKAAAIAAYGGPEQVSVRDLPAPSAGPGEIVVDIKAASLNPIDWKMREGFLRSRVDLKMPHILGRDFSGVVRSVGAGVTDFKPGDQVWGAANQAKPGTHAEQIAVDVNLVGLKPPSLSHIEAASLGIAAGSAYAALVQTAPPRRGQQTLVHAGAGGVGSFAIQLAKHAGAIVTATAGAANQEYLRKRGADRALNYAKQDFAADGQFYDIIFDTMGGVVHNRSIGALKPGGTLVYLNAAPIKDAPARADVKVVNSPVRVERGMLDGMAALVAKGALTPPEIAVFRLDDARKAYALVESGHVRGKVVFAIGE